ncbi:MAG: hypothetical protein HYU77_04435 [Betaproteobacteria bacterium]|nr:hypothetical protein [Betaproteobacteria bacterium]
MSLLIGPDVNARAARVLRVVALGERLAEEGARLQATLARHPRMARFLRHQASQEQLHAFAFEAGIRYLAPKADPAELPGIKALNQFRERLLADLEQGRLAESLVGLQMVLEGIAMEVLSRLRLDLARNGARFEPLRRRLLRQEESHHAFGAVWLPRMAAEGRTDRERLRAATGEYLLLGNAVLEGCGELFADFGAPLARYREALRQALPEWLREGTA